MVGCWFASGDSSSICTTRIRRHGRSRIRRHGRISGGVSIGKCDSWCDCDETKYFDGHLVMHTKPRSDTVDTPAFHGQSQSQHVPAQVEFNGGNTTPVVFLLLCSGVPMTKVGLGLEHSCGNDSPGVRSGRVQIMFWSTNDKVGLGLEHSCGNDSVK
jgi:hypothetical protein